MTGSAPDTGCHWQEDDWLVASMAGVWRGRPGVGWQLLGPYEYAFNCLLRLPGRIIAGSDTGLWQADAGVHVWRQLHDEILTMVQDVALTGGAADEPGWLAASGYGVHTAQPAAHGALRWRNHSAGLPTTDARFALRLLALDDGGWAVATEDGLWLTDATASTWLRTSIAATAVRALHRGPNGMWAGTDAGDLWRSADGRQWQRVAAAPAGAALLALSELVDGRLLAGTTTGVAIGDGAGQWQECGPSLTVTSVAGDPTEVGVWALGATPGGLWWTQDGGRHWTHAAEVPAAVREIDTP